MMTKVMVVIIIIIIMLLVFLVVKISVTVLQNNSPLFFARVFAQKNLKYCIFEISGYLESVYFKLFII